MRLFLLAQSSSDNTVSTIEWEWPTVWADWVPVGLLIIALVATLWWGYRSRRQLSTPWALFLTGLRLVVIGLAIAIALNPHERTQTDAYRDSRVILLVDTSQSMQQTESDPLDEPSATPRTRAEAVHELMAKSELLAELRKTHTVDIYTFDEDLSDLKSRLPSRYQKPSDSSEESSSSPEVKWEELLEPKGYATRMGDSLDALLVESKSSTLSGVVVISDGASNAGRDLAVPRNRAREMGVRVVTVGVGSTEPPVNLEVVRLVAPTDVQKGDAFELTAQLRGQGLAGQNVRVDLFQQGPLDSESSIVFSRDHTLPEDGSPTEVLFELTPPDAGAYEYVVKAEVVGGRETRDDDNQLSRTVNIFDRPLKVLIIAGGPLWDYRFASTTLRRHPSVDVSIWLQSGGTRNQEMTNSLQKFPETIEELFEYDALLTYDADWSLLTPEQQTLLTNWISNEGGGLIFVAGEVHTPALAQDSNTDLEAIRRLCPVLLEPVSLRLGAHEIAETAFPVHLTQEGQVSEFLKLEESGEPPAWENFPGIYRTYPTRGAKAGTTVYAEFTDPLSRGTGGQPIVIAAQRYGQGQVVYLGSPEMWRFRAVNPSYLDRLWIKLVRKAAEGRSKRGLQRNMIILEGREYVLGQSVPLRVRALDAQFQPLVSDTLNVTAYQASGVPVTPDITLLRDPIRPAEYIGDFRPTSPGRYRLELTTQSSTETVSAEIDVQFPRQEAASLIQEVAQLEGLSEGTGGAYLPLAQAAVSLPDLLPNKGEYIVIDQQVRELWDKRWLMFLIALLLSAEWLTRKLLKLA